jgi:hypothetical protein
MIECGAARSYLSGALPDPLNCNAGRTASCVRGEA